MNHLGQKRKEQYIPSHQLSQQASAAQRSADKSLSYIDLNDTPELVKLKRERLRSSFGSFKGSNTESFVFDFS